MKSNKLIPLICFLGVSFCGHAQNENEDCKAFIDVYVAQYEGECKKGLADGDGKTIGKDYYVGQFKKGKPHGDGKFTWENGNFYDGKWKKGLKNGLGKLVLRRELMGDSTIVGVWKNDAYVGEEEIADWKVISSRGVTRYKFQQISEDDANNEVQIKFRRNGTKFNLMQALQLSGSGIQFADQLAVGFKGATFPFEGRVDMTVPNQLNTNTYYVSFEYIINKPGKWVLTFDL
ncbi:MAG: hypothetical protein ABJP45_11880 [Cyclobacteriaceae bacterium]